MVRKPDAVHKLAGKPAISGLPNDESLDLIAQLVNASDDTDPDPDLVDHSLYLADELEARGLQPPKLAPRRLPCQCVGMSLPAAVP